MWTELPTLEVALACLPPFSFYFDLVEVYWKTTVASPKYSLQRICTLMRKQGAESFIVESALQRLEIKAEIDTLDALLGSGGAAEAVSISFFSKNVLLSEVESVETDAFLGQVVLINYRKPGSANFDLTYIHEALLPTPALRRNANIVGLLNNFVCADAQFMAPVKGRQFPVRAIYYCQQNSLTHVCAHSALRMALNTVDGNSGQLSSATINQLLGVSPPLSGLQISDIEHVINASSGMKAFTINCTKLSPQTFVSALASIVESGFVALLAFTTAGSVGHVVTVFGHTRNSDQWHPQAIPAYGGPTSAPYYTGSAWISQFLIHDDNFGPYYTLSNRALDSDPQVKAEWIIALMPTRPDIPPNMAEAIGSAVLSNNLSNFAPLSSGRWFEYVTRANWTYVLRTILITKDRYLAHLKAESAHDGSSISDIDLQKLTNLPNEFWMVEFSLPSLFVGNRSKLGEVFITTNTPASLKIADCIIGIRLPNLVVTFNPQTNFDFPITSHIPLYQARTHDHVW